LDFGYGKIAENNPFFVGRNTQVIPLINSVCYSDYSLNQETSNSGFSALDINSIIKNLQSTGMRTGFTGRILIAI